VTGALLHQSGGAHRDEVPFQTEKIGDRLWRVRRSSLQAGEYGFLAPGLSSVSISASGKMYRFSVPEGEGEATKGIASQDERKTVARRGSDRIVSTPEFGDATIGASTDANPKVRHDGITLDRVTPSGPAERAGIRTGDVILAVDDHYLFTAEDLDTEIKHHQPGTRAVRYRRHSTIYDTSLVGAQRVRGSGLALKTLHLSWLAATNLEKLNANQRTATRQNAGVSSAVEEPGRVNWPAGTGIDDAIDTWGRLSFTRSVHFAALA
jgi:hypothetical protein